MWDYYLSVVFAIADEHASLRALSRWRMETIKPLSGTDEKVVLSLKGKDAAIDRRF